ncbi:MAG: hypothetical protein ACOYBY_14330 [Dermatophilaceae bacterium]
MSLRSRLQTLPRERLAERVSAASYGTILVLAALPLISAAEVSSGWGWELVSGVGLATWVAHLYAEVVGDHVRTGAVPDRTELNGAMADGLPILLAAVPPAAILLVGRLGVVDPRVAVWAAVAVAVVQLLGLGAFVGRVAAPNGGATWWYAAVTAAIGVAVVLLKVGLGH